MDSSGVNVATTKLPGQFPASQTGAGSDIMDNQLRATFQHNIESSQGSRGVAPYPPLSRGLGGSRSDVEHMPNTLGSGANMPTGPYVTDRASGGVQVSLSMLPPVSCSDRPREPRQCPGPKPRPTVPPSTTPKQENATTVRLEWQPLRGSADLRLVPKGLMAVRLWCHFLR